MHLCKKGDVYKVKYGRLCELFISLNTHDLILNTTWIA